LLSTVPYRRSGAMMRGEPGGGAVGSLGFVTAVPPAVPLPAPDVLRLLGLELRPEPLLLKLPPGPLPTVGVFARIPGWFG
jgi:hypothetical protein